MKSLQKKLRYLLLCLTVLALLPFGIRRAAAALSVNPAVLRQNIVGDLGITGGGQNWVYFGDYDGLPIKWRVLSSTKNGDSFQDGWDAAYTGNGLFLMSETMLGSSIFNPPGSEMVTPYQGSVLQTACKSLYESSFSDIEKEAILQTTKIDSAVTITDGDIIVNYGTSSLNRDRLFPLSAAEAIDNTYGFSNSYYDDARRKEFEWWLRSPEASLYFTGSVYLGEMSNAAMDWELSILPAFNLNASFTYLASAAMGGKPSGTEGPDALVAVAAGAPTEWKLTLPDINRHNFKASIAGTIIGSGSATAVAPGSKVPVIYSGATIGPKEYVSAILADDQGNALYYGRIKNIADASDADGNLYITIPYGLAMGSYTLKIFSEQYNGDYETDYASNLQNFSLTVDNTAPIVMAVTPSGYAALTDGSITITFNEYMNTTTGTVSLDNSATSLTGGVWTADNTVYTVPYCGLSNSTEYTVTLSGFQDVAGNGVVSDGNARTFTTIDEPGSIGSISGIVTDEAGVPISGAEVHMLQGFNDVTSSVTYEDGSFSLNVPAGWGYTLFIYKPGYTDYYMDEVRIAPDTTTSGVNISLESDMKGCLVTYKGAQKRYNPDNKTYDIRLIATIDTLNADEVGFVFSKSETIPNFYNSTGIGSTNVYTSITANGTTVTAKSLNGEYIIAVTVTGIPEADANITLYVRGYSVVEMVEKYTPVFEVIVNKLP